MVTKNKFNATLYPYFVESFESKSIVFAFLAHTLPKYVKAKINGLSLCTRLQMQ